MRGWNLQNRVTPDLYYWDCPRASGDHGRCNGGYGRMEGNRGMESSSWFLWKRWRDKI